jgi:hypothetical protein
LFERVDIEKIFPLMKSSSTTRAKSVSARSSNVKPVARLVSYTPKGAVRRPGSMRGKIRIKKNFDAPLPKELLASFEGMPPIIV